MSKQIASPYVLAMTYKARDAKTSSLVFISEPQGHARSAMTCKASVAVRKGREKQ